MSYAQLDKLKKATAILSIWLRKGGTGKSLEPLQKLEKYSHNMFKNDNLVSAKNH